MIDIKNIRYKIKTNNLVGVLELIYKKMTIERKRLSSIKKNQTRNNV